MEYVAQLFEHKDDQKNEEFSRVFPNSTTSLDNQVRWSMDIDLAQAITNRIQNRSLAFSFFNNYTAQEWIIYFNNLQTADPETYNAIINYFIEPYANLHQISQATAYMERFILEQLLVKKLDEITIDALDESTYKQLRQRLLNMNSRPDSFENYIAQELQELQNFWTRRGRILGYMTSFGTFIKRYPSTTLTTKLFHVDLNTLVSFINTELV